MEAAEIQSLGQLRLDVQPLEAQTGDDWLHLAVLLSGVMQESGLRRAACSRCGSLPVGKSRQFGENPMLSNHQASVLLVQE
jgi:hypothetical protein